MIIFSIKNEKLNYFNRPIYFESTNECLHYIQNVMLSDADRVLCSLRGDLNLYKLGEIDFSTGIILNDLEPFCVASLDSIFDSIPEDHIPRTEKEIREAIVKLKQELESFTLETSEKFKACGDELDLCKKIKKRGVLFDKISKSF